ncbi:methyltransferase [Streptomyces sp. TRM70350]|uniref:methyltransferase n=1 Tax=Streptomyces sp. TRM70350 TaxID=2856165 RepID=UPI00210F9F6F|nr:methyltransferase [Streptomyces sp. TRM70350]
MPQISRNAHTEQTNEGTEIRMSNSGPENRSLAVWELADLVTPMAVRVAATYRVADHIAAGRATAEDIARAEQLHAGALERVLRHLVTVGVLTFGGGTYGLTGLGEQLRTDHPGGQHRLVDLGGALGRGDLSLVELAHVVRTGEPAYAVRYGLPYWEDLAADRALAESFDAIMADNLARDVPSIAAAYDWAALGHVYDLGGGSGVLLGGLLAAHPALRGTVVDLKATAARAADHFRALGLADRAEVVGGSFFDELPAGGGGYILSSVLHNWSDDDALRILGRCADAVADGGRVLVIEETGERPETAMDLRMLAYFAGVERGVDDLARLAARAGLKLTGVFRAGSQAAGVRSVLELVREDAAH